MGRYPQCALSLHAGGLHSGKTLGHDGGYYRKMGECEKAMPMPENHEVAPLYEGSPEAATLCRRKLH